MTLLTALPKILETIFISQSDSSQQQPEQRHVPSWLDKIDISLQRVRDIPDPESEASFTSFLSFARKSGSKAKKLSKQKVQQMDDHTFSWSATIEMLSLLLDVNNPSLARLCHHNQHAKSHRISIHEILPQHAIATLGSQNAAKDLGNFYHNLDAEAGDQR